MTINELPVGWIKATLNDVAEYLNGLAFKPSDWEETGTPIIRIQNLTNLQKEFNYTTKNFKKEYLIHRGDILLSWSATLDVFIWQRENAWLNQHIFKVTPNEHMDGRFVFYLLKDALYKLIHSEFLHGSTMRHINRGPFLKHNILLPPLAEQKRIVGKIEELFAEVDKGIDLLKQKQAELKKYRQSVLSAAFSGKLYKTTEWQETTFAKSFKAISPKSKIKTKDYLEEGTFPIIDQGENYIGGYWDKEEDVITVETPLICFGDHTRRFKYIDFNFVAGADGLKIFQPKDFIPKCAYYYALALKFPNKGYARHSGYLKKCKMYIPSLSEQEQLVAEIEQRFEKADILEKSIEDALESAEKLKQSILKKAFEGKLVPQDPNDEPASILLERIKSEQPPKKGKRK